ncbi:MAG: amino acid deaminase/aldolase [Caldilinea sp. CFX5]|nr:amino acid deaminase/aldolase [Caldilinea sp. CFX5]
MPNYQTWKALFAGQALPFAFVDLDAFDRNIRALVDRAGDKRIRIATKSIRSRSLLRHLLGAHPQIQGLMCFTGSETVWLSQQGFDDLLLGYPIWQPEAIQAICAEVRQGKTITLMLDSVEHVAHLQALAQVEQVTLPVCLDVDLSIDFPGLHFGVWRSGVTTVEQALLIWQALQASPNLTLTGVMGYEAQIAGVGDNAPNNALRNRLIRWLKMRSLAQIARRRGAIVQVLQAHGAQLHFINGGGTGSMESTQAEPRVTEITVGSGFYAPALFDHYRAFQHEPAAGFAIEIVRQPKAGIYTCHGGGYIASGSIGADKQPVIWLPTRAKLTALEGAGEVQTPVQYTGPEPLQLGDPIFLRHSKAGELCERFNTLLLVRGAQIVAEAPTYRGEGKCFL